MKQAMLMSVVAVAAALALRATAADAKSVRMWDPETVATVAGTVDAVEPLEMGEAWRCVRLRLRTDAGTLLVRVGPDWFLTERKHLFTVGERLEVKGSRLTFAGEPALVAAEIVRGSERIVLRDASGRPAWAGK